MLLHLSLDLHVLGTPPAFILSQDQTLRNIFSPFQVSFLTGFLTPTYFASYHSSIVKVLPACHPTPPPSQIPAQFRRQCPECSHSFPIGFSVPSPARHPRRLACSIIRGLLSRVRSERRSKILPRPVAPVKGENQRFGHQFSMRVTLPCAIPGNAGNNISFFSVAVN